MILSTRPVGLIHLRKTCKLLAAPDFQSHFVEGKELLHTTLTLYGLQSAIHFAKQTKRSRADGVPGHRLRATLTLINLFDYAY